MACIRVAQSLALDLPDADRALKELLTETRVGAVSTIALKDKCLLRLLRRHDIPRSRECLMTWEPPAAQGCSFIGSLSIVDRGPSTTPALVLEGTETQLGAAEAEALGRAVLQRITTELTSRMAQRFTRNAAPMLHTAGPKSARMG